MRRLISIPLVCCFAVAAPAAQSPPTQPPTQPPTSASEATPPAAPAAPPPPAAPAKPRRSLFEETWRPVPFRARVTNEKGDPARWQRYQDFEEGALFTDARYERKNPAAGWL